MAPRPGKRPWPEYLRRCAARRAAMAREVRRGQTVSEVAARFGAEHSLVYRACREHGLKVGRGGNAGYWARRARERRAIADAVGAGATVAEAARRFGRTRDFVRAACREHGVPLPKRAHPERARALQARAALGKRPEARLRSSARGENGWPGAARGMAEVARLLAETDLTYAEIGKRCGLSRQRVGQVMRELRGR